MQINLPLYREHFNIVYNKLYITFKPVLSYTYPPPDSGVFFIFIGDIPIKGLNTELTKTKKIIQLSIVQDSNSPNIIKISYFKKNHWEKTTVNPIGLFAYNFDKPLRIHYSTLSRLCMKPKI